MAPLKQPPTLLMTAIECIWLFVINTCKTIEKTYGNWNNLETKKAVQKLQQFLLSQLNGKMLTEIHNECSRSYYMSGIDPRIHTMVYMHKDMKRYESSHRYASTLNTDMSFWISVLPRTRNVVYLNFHKSCSDAVLKIVSDNCSSLEYIDIGLLEEVSNTGLKYLGNCLKLEVIKMKQQRRTCILPRLSITYEGISYLLKNLPYLEIITYNNMSPVISQVKDSVDSLALKQIKFLDPNVSLILTASILCSNLQELCLKMYKCKSEKFIIDTYDTLKTSSLQVSVLKLIGFIVNLSLIELLCVKGNFLKKFKLEANVINENIVVAIGKYCPNINTLDLQVSRNVRVYYNNSSDVQISDDLSKVSSFQHNFKYLKLESLKLYALTTGNLSSVITLILSNAKQIKKLKLKVRDKDCSADEIMNDVLRKNPMVELRKLHAFCTLSMKTILYFFNCPHMTKLTFMEHSGISDDDVQRLKCEITENNLDISILTLGRHYYNNWWYSN